jgi:RNA polymerase sigma-70 factor (ECF subfamily)
MRSEEELEQLVRHHDAAALAELLERYRSRLRVFVTRNMSTALQQKIGADDILQETGISCLDALPEIDFADRSPFEWICHVAKRRIVDAGRRYAGAQKRDLKREVGLHAGGEAGDQGGVINLLVASITSPSKAFSRDQREFRLWAAFEQLPEESRRALHLRYVESLPTKEIAARLGKSDGAVRVMLTRSLRKLEGILENRP